MTTQLGVFALLGAFVLLLVGRSFDVARATHLGAIALPLAIALLAARATGHWEALLLGLVTSGWVAWRPTKT